MKTRNLFLMAIIFLVAIGTSAFVDVKKLFDGKIRPIKHTNPLALRGLSLGNRDSIFQDGVTGKGLCFSSIKMKGQIYFNEKYRKEWVKYITISYEHNTGRELSLQNLVGAISSARWETVYVYDHEIITDGRDPLTGEIVFSWLPEKNYLLLVYDDPETGKLVPLIKDECFNHLFIMKPKIWEDALDQEQVQDSLAGLFNNQPAKKDSVAITPDTTTIRKAQPVPTPVPPTQPVPCVDCGIVTGTLGKQKAVIQPMFVDTTTYATPCVDCGEPVGILRRPRR